MSEKPWDGQEPITEAMQRCGVRDAFQSAVNRGDRDEAVRMLCQAGVDYVTAWEMFDFLSHTDDETQ
jgi:hypothetical protein